MNLNYNNLIGQRGNVIAYNGHIFPITITNCLIEGVVVRYHTTFRYKVIETTETSEIIKCLEDVPDFDPANTYFEIPFERYNESPDSNMAWFKTGDLRILISLHNYDDYVSDDIKTFFKHNEIYLNDFGKIEFGSWRWA